MPSAGELEEVARAKQAVRQRVWARLERERAARFILWEHLDAARVAIPALAARKPGRADG
jgi:hypothetical protein